LQQSSVPIGKKEKRKTVREGEEAMRARHEATPRLPSREHDHTIGFLPSFPAPREKER